MTVDNKMQVREKMIFVKKYGLFILIIATVMAAVIAVGVRKYENRNPVYTANVQLVVKPEKKIETISDEVQQGTINSGFMFTLKDLIRSDRVLAEAIKNVYGSNYYSTKQLYGNEIPKLKGAIQLTLNEKSTILSYSVVDSNPKVVTKLANAITRYTKQEERNVWGRSSIGVLSKAETVGMSKHRSTIKMLGLGFIIGLFMATPMFLIVDARK